MKRLTIISSLLLSCAFLGCSNGGNNTDDTKREEKAAQAQPKIEIIQNDNAREEKVAAKKKSDTQGNAYYYDYGQKSEYDPKSQPANDDASVRVRPRTKIDANMHVRSPYEEVQVSLLARKLSKEFILRCSPCHNDYANGVIGPSLLGKSADYIYDKIISFKEDEKKNVLMSALVKQMSDAQLRTIAEDIYNFNLQIEKIRN